MRLARFTDENAKKLYSRIEALPVSELDPRLKIAATDEDAKAVVALLIGKKWRLLLEDSIYEFSGQAFDEVTEEPPWNTTGDMWSLDPDTGLVGYERISFDEGEIQGQVYALERLLHGGKLSPEQYVDFLVEEYNRLDIEAMRDDAERLSFDRAEVLAGHNHEVVGMLAYAGLAKHVKREVVVGYSF